MKMKINKNGKQEEIDIDFWDFFKGSIMSYLLFSGMLVFGIFLYNIIFAI